MLSGVRRCRGYPNTGVALRARDLPTPPTADPLVELAFQRVAGWFPPRWPDPAYPQQLHLDIRVHDAELAEHELIALVAQRHFVMCRLLACQGEGGGFGPLSFNGLLGHQGDCGGLCVDGKAAPDGLLGSMQVGQGAPAADGQVGGGAAELALVWREGGKGVGDRARQGTERAGSRGASQSTSSPNQAVRSSWKRNGLNAASRCSSRASSAGPIA
jgi:hypothetical protein